MTLINYNLFENVSWYQIIQNKTRNNFKKFLDTKVRFSVRIEKTLEAGRQNDSKRSEQIIKNSGFKSALL